MKRVASTEEERGKWARRGRQIGEKDETWVET